MTPHAVEHRYRVAYRVIRLRELVSRQEVTAARLQYYADLFGVSTRTIRRDLAALHAMGEPVAPFWDATIAATIWHA